MKTVVSLLAVTLLFAVACTKDQNSSGNTAVPRGELVDIESLNNFQTNIAQGVSLVFFHATWCPKCAAQRPAVEGLVNDPLMKDVFFGQVNYERITAVAAEANVLGFPTIVLYRAGKEENRFAGQGHSQEKLREALEKLL